MALGSQGGFYIPEQRHLDEEYSMVQYSTVQYGRVEYSIV